MKNFGLIAWYVLVGAISFWLPDIILNAVNATSLWRSTALPAISFFIVYGIAKNLRSRNNTSVAVFMIIGVWLFASTAMLIAATFSGGGVRNGFADTATVLLLGLLPPYTFMISAYDGSLLGLLLTTFLAVGSHFVLERDHWILPASLQDSLRRWYTSRTA